VSAPELAPEVTLAVHRTEERADRAVRIERDERTARAVEPAHDVVAAHALENRAAGCRVELAVGMLGCDDRGREAEVAVGTPRLFGVYHPSQQNTQTGRVTPAMYVKVLANIRHFLEQV